MSLTVEDTAGPAPQSPAGPDRPVVTPEPGGPFMVALADVRAAFRMSPVWLQTGWTDVIWKYRRTKIGPFWHTLNLAAFVIVMGVIWSVVLNQDPLQHFRYVATSLTVWSLISSMITEGAGSIIGGQATALSMRYPYVAFAFGHVWRSLLLFGHHMLLYVAILVFTLYPPTWALLLLIPGLILVLLNGVWMSLLIGIICLRRRDVSQIVASLMQIAMFVTPIFWPRDLLGDKFSAAVDYNPLYHFVEILRGPMLGNVPTAANWAWAIGALIVGSALTAYVYGRTRDRLAFWY